MALRTTVCSFNQLGMPQLAQSRPDTDDVLKRPVTLFRDYEVGSTTSMTAVFMKPPINTCQYGDRILVSGGTGQRK